MKERKFRILETKGVFKVQYSYMEYPYSLFPPIDLILMILGKFKPVEKWGNVYPDVNYTSLDKAKDAVDVLRKPDVIHEV